MREIYFYRSDSGECPVEAFLVRLDGRQAQKIAWVLRLVKELPMVPKQYFKKLEGTQDIWEVRADLGNDAFRLLGFWDQGQLIILTNAFAKKSQKAPAREITLAEQRRADYLNRKKKL
ncbi:MAG TPA: type II toxin-antitoxin system RelE/ParE family toxin [Verrucomicrobiae bacterium]